jgi:uncharacterized protein
MNKENHKVAVVTGSTSGIGKAFATEFAERGYDLILTGRRKEIIEQVARNLRSAYRANVQVIIADFVNEKDLDEMISVIKSLERIDVLVNNAGFGHKYAYKDESTKNMRDMITVHDMATVQLTRAVLPRMIAARMGTVINVSSLGAFLPMAGAEIYSGSKSFINGFTLSLSFSVKEFGIKVQALCPGLTRTDFHSKIDADPSRLVNDGPVRWMSAHAVVVESLRALKKTNKVIVIPGFWNKLLYFYRQTLPWSVYCWIVTRRFSDLSAKDKVFDGQKDQ